MYNNYLLFEELLNCFSKWLHSSFFLLSINKVFFFFFNGSMVVYNMLVSGMQQRDSVVYSSLKNIYVFLY